MKVLFMGRKESGAHALRWLDENVGEIVGVVSEQAETTCPVRRAAAGLGISVWDREHANELIDAGQVECDIGVSFLYPHKIVRPLLGLPKHGIINFHPAPLPDFKGTGGYNVAILEQLEEWGVSAHYVDADIDTGPIIDCVRFPIDPDSGTALSVERLSQTFLLQLFERTMRRIASGEAIDAMPNRGGRYISRAEMESMKRVVPGDDVERKIRAFWFPPYIGAYVEIDGTRYTLVSDGILHDIASWMQHQKSSSS